MNIEQLREYCLSLPHTTEDLPFDEWTLCFKVGGKIFAITGLDNPVLFVNLKCDPAKAIQLREEYEDVEPGFHMNKKHWNTVTLSGKIADDVIKEWITHSYELVFKGLPAKVRNSFA